MSVFAVMIIFFGCDVVVKIRKPSVSIFFRSSLLIREEISFNEEAEPMISDDEAATEKEGDREVPVKPLTDIFFIQTQHTGIRYFFIPQPETIAIFSMKSYRCY